jgi:hypothetical protein
MGTSVSPCNKGARVRLKLRVPQGGRAVATLFRALCLLLVVYRCTRSDSPHPPPGPAHSFPDYWLMVHLYPYTRRILLPSLPTRARTVRSSCTVHRCTQGGQG